MNSPKHEIIQDFLGKLYQDLNGYLKYSQEQRTDYLHHDICLTYGEVQYLSLMQFAEEIKLHAEDVFLDLGSGLGKICTSILLGTSCKQVIGIEASTSLHQQAIKILPKLNSFLEPEHKKIKLLEGNFLAAEMLPEIKRATVVFINSTAFTYDLLDKISDMLNQCSNIRVVLSFKPFAHLALPFDKTITIEASWDTILSRLYSRKTLPD